jgi:hypothetical protein
MTWAPTVQLASAIQPTSALPVAYTDADPGLTRTPKMETRSPAAGSRRLGGAAGQRAAPPGAAFVKGKSGASAGADKPKPRGSFSTNTVGGRRGSGSGGGRKSAVNSLLQRVGNVSPKSVGRRLKVQFNSPANVTR